MGNTFSSNKGGSTYTPISSDKINFDLVNFVGPLTMDQRFQLNQAMFPEEMEVEELPMDDTSETIKTDDELLSELNKESSELKNRLAELEKKKKEYLEILKHTSDNAALNLLRENEAEIQWIKERRKAIFKQKREIEYKDSNLSSLFEKYPDLENEYKKLKADYENMKSAGVAERYTIAKEQLDEKEKALNDFKNNSQRIFDLDKNKEELVTYLDLKEKFENTTSPSDKEYYGKLLSEQKQKMLEQNFVLSLDELNNEITTVSNALNIEPLLFTLPEKKKETIAEIESSPIDDDPDPLSFVDYDENEIIAENEPIDDDPDPLSFVQYDEFDQEINPLHTQLSGDKPTYDYSDLQTSGRVNKEDFPNISGKSQYDNYVGQHNWALNIYDEEKQAYWEKLCKERGIENVVGISREESYTPYFAVLDKNGDEVIDENGNVIYTRDYAEHGMIPVEIINGTFYAGREVNATDIIMDACEFYGYEHPEDILALWLHETTCGTYSKNGGPDGVTPHAFGVLKGKFSTDWFKYNTGVEDLNDPAQSIWGIVASFANRVHLFESPKDPTGRQARANAFGSWASGVGGFLDYGYDWTHDGNAPMDVMVFNGQATGDTKATTYGFMVLSDAIAANDMDKLKESNSNKLTMYDYTIQFDENGGYYHTDIPYTSTRLFQFHNTH